MEAFFTSWKWSKSLAIHERKCSLDKKLLGPLEKKKESVFDITIVINQAVGEC